MADTTPTVSLLSRLTRARPRPLALEQRFVFDGAGAGDAVDAAATPAPVEPADQSADAPIKVEVAQNAPAERQGTTAERSNLFQSGGSHPTVNEAAATAADQIRQFLAQASDEQLFELFNGGQTTPSEQWTAELAHLRTSIADGTLEIGVRLLDNAQIKGALAAYAPEGLGGAPTILLNRDWLGVLNTEQVSRLLVEEYGHHLDHILNQGIDTAGDEGQRFAAAITGQDTGTPGFAADDDHATLRLDGESIDVEFATLTFSNAYKVNTATTPAGKESNSHDFVFSSLGQVSITDASNSRFFSGNDVSATALAIGTDVYYGWISRPIKSGGVVRGFYFWTDTDFNSLAAAQADGNQDGDSNVADNRGFLLVLDQAWFDAQAWKNQAANIKNVGSSSDRVDAALNSFVGAPVTPAATADVANGTPGTAGGAAVEAGGVGNATAGSAATGNVLSNDTGGDGKRVIAAGTTSASQSVTAATTSADGVPVTGLYGTLTLGADGSYRYVVNDANPQVQALRVASDTLVDTFTYRMTDASGATSTTTLSVTIQGANDAPVASNDYNTAKESIAGSGQYGASDTSGSLAVGNVLNNDTDVDRGDTKTVVTTTISGLASAITDGSSTTTVNLTASTGAISANDYVFLKNSNGSLTALRDGAGDVVRVSKVVSSQIYLSDSAAVSALPGGSTLLFANKPDGTGAAKTATLQSVTTTITASASLVISSSSGSIAEGMTVTGNGIESGTLISSVKYDSAWKIVGVTLNKNVALSATTELAFSNSATVGTNLTGQYGTLELIADGKYTYIPNSNNQALNEGQSAVEQFQYTMRDASGATSSATLFITVLGSGTNDPNAVNDTGTATEAGGTANGIVDTNPSGNLLANDTNGANVVVSGRPASTSTIATIGTNTQLVGLYGTLTLSSDGSYTYMVDNSNASVQALRDISTTLSDTFIYSVENGQTANGVRLQDSATLTITVRGANDAPVAADTVATAIEAGGVNNGTAGYNPSGNVLDVVTDVDDASSELRVTAVRLGGIEGSGNAGTVGSALTGLYGSLMLNADGSWTYTVDNNNAIVQALNPGQTLTERFNYSVTDRSGTGLTDIAVLTITIDGAADTVAVNSVFVNEASPYAVFTVSGSAGVAVRLELGTASLPSTDTLAALSGAGADIANSLEYFNGSNWQLYVANSSVIIPTGDKLLVRVAVNQDDVHEGNESFTLTATVSQGNSSTGIGTINDEGGEEGEGDIYLPGNTSGTPDSGGTLDDDRPTLSVTSPQVNEGAYAEFVVSLDKRSTQPVSFSPVLASDTANIGVDTGTTAQIERFDGNNWITVNGPVSIAAGELSVRLRIATVDDSFVEPSEMFSLVTGAISGTVTNLGGAAGIATIIDNDTQAPNNRAPVAVNDSLTATEDTPVNYSAAQLLGNDSDPDNDTISIASVTRGTGGDVALNSDGSVSFTPDPDFNGTATFTYTVTDGTLVSSSATVTISVAAVNDAAVISGIGTGVVTEDLNVTAGNLTTGGSLTVTDPDAGQASFQGTVTPSAGALGSLTIAPNGTWSYSVPNGAVQYLKAGETKVETFTVRSLDGTEHAVSVTINGVNDAAVISGIGTGAVTEDLNVTAGNLTTGGSLTVTDPDAGQASFQGTVTPSAGALGSLVIAPDGTWSYSVPNGAVQYLKAGETKVETFTVRSLDGTAHAVNVTINGVNDAAVISGIGTGVVTEDLNVTAGNLTTGGSLTVTDPDAGQASFQGTITPSAGALGSLVIAPDGTWSYSVPNGAVQYLKAGETKVETFTVRSLDGTEHAVSVTINGVNDAAVISGIGTGAVTEDLNVTAGNLTTGGSLTVTDSDAGQASFQSTVTPSAGALGSLTIAPNGTWSYSVPNSAVQYLKAGETKVETFTVRSLDGTAHTVTVTINGVNDPALFAPGGQQGNVQEDTLLRSDGQISVTDADQGEAMIVAQPATRGQYGEFSIDSAGRWRYALDNANPAVQALGTADRRAETFTVTARDGTTTTVTITVQGLDESAVPQPQPQPQPVPRPVPPVVVAPPQPAAPLPVPIPAAPEPVAPPVQPVAFDTTIAPSNTLAAPAPVAAPLIAAVQSRDLDLGLHSRAPFVDIYTQRAGFQIVVIEAPQARLSLYHGVSDQYADAGAQTSFSVPYDAFAHTDPNERILLSATQANGQPLPGWVRFDPQSGKFELNTPANYRGELTIKILARDSQGREASSLFRFNVGDRKTSDATGRTTLSDQLRQVAAQRPVQALERALSTSRPVAEPAQPEGSPNETLPGNKAG